jgi:hypothetical protein
MNQELYRILKSSFWLIILFVAITSGYSASIIAQVNNRLYEMKERLSALEVVQPVRIPVLLNSYSSQPERSRLRSPSNELATATNSTPKAVWSYLEARLE